jgi:1,4-alpha-glucan branching enzyme
MLKKRYVKSRDVCKVTFELPKDEMPDHIEPQSVHLVGEFNGWDPTATEMPRRRGGVYRVMLELEPGRAYQFRYLINGEQWWNDWNADDYVPGVSGADNCLVVTPASP